MNQFGTEFSLSAEHGKISCPHCGQFYVDDSNSTFLTHALSPEQEAEFVATSNIRALNETTANTT